MVKVVISVLLVGFVALVLRLCRVLWEKPRKMRAKLEKQGIRGPPPSNFLAGNVPEMKRIQLQALSTPNLTNSSYEDNKAPVISHDWTSTIFAYLHKWRHEYGPIFLYSTGSIQLLSITDVEMVKELGLHRSLALGKPSYLSKDRGPLLGEGILSSSGPLWAHQRKIIAPEFYVDKVKNMVDRMVEATVSLQKSWETRIEKEGGISNIRIDADLRCLSADIISRVCFGSGYSSGEEIFSKLRALQKVMSNGNVGIPLLRRLPTKNNKVIRRLEEEIRTMILEVVRQRKEKTNEEDLLQMILEGAESFGDLDGAPATFSKDQFIVDNCKNIYFAGHETTATTTSWSLLLLSAHPEWQDRARAEVLQSCKDGLPDADAIRNLKTLTMVIQETLRLYPPAVFVVREALEDISFQGIQIPKGMSLQIPIPILQHSPELWGPDVDEFKPDRFANGVLRACKEPQAYMPFGVGSRMCAGQHFAMAEMKVILAVLLSRFQFSVSPAYRHSPAFRLLIEPENGISLLVNRVQCP